MRQLKLFGYAFTLALSIISCNRDNENFDTIIQEDGYRKGILVANEGNFGRPNANISYISSDLSQIDNDLYTTINGENLGDVLQNVGFNGNDAYFVANNSNKIIVADRYTFTKKSEITEEINQPRYITFNNHNAYITNSTGNYVSIYNTSNHSFIKKIEIFDTVERIESVGNYVFVQNAAWGSGNKITQISTQSNEITDIITLNEVINKITAYQNSLYAITSDGNNSYIYQIDNEGDIVKTISLTGIANAKNLEIDNDIFYFTAGIGVYAMPISATSPNLVFNVKDNGWSTLYGFNVIDNLIYTSDAQGFTQGSEINVYTTSGTLVKTFTAGMGTNAFYKN